MNANPFDIKTVIVSRQAQHVALVTSLKVEFLSAVYRLACRNGNFYQQIGESAFRFWRIGTCPIRTLPAGSAAPLR
jgi:hypothetical protein